MSNYKIHAVNEFRAAGWTDENGKFDDEMQEAICNHVLALLDVFANEGHSGSSAPYAIDLFSKLAKFEPIVPLTGEDWEWTEPFDGNGTLQNKRCGHVFKGPDGIAYDIDGKVFVEPDGCSYTSSDSLVNVTFPYTPTTEYVHVEGEVND